MGTLLKTPFDELRTIFSISYPPPIREDINVAVNGFIGILRALYVQQIEYAQTLLSIPAHLTEEMAEEINDSHVLCRISYFQFIEQLNILQRVLEKLGIRDVIPLYYRIRFFRNKIVEHWDDYLQFITSRSVQMISVRHLIFVPYHMGRGVIPEHRTQTLNALIQLFNDNNTTLAIDNNDWYDAYSEKVYKALENIDPRLRSKVRAQNSGIEEDIVKALFNYMFPTPISDVESYSKDLVIFLRSIIP